jgi:hypothetical protein
MGMNLPLSLFLDLVRLSRQRVKALVGGRWQRQQQQPQQLYVPLLQYDQYDDEVRCAVRQSVSLRYIRCKETPRGPADPMQAPGHYSCPAVCVCVCCYKRPRQFGT